MSEYVHYKKFRKCRFWVGMKIHFRNFAILGLTGILQTLKKQLFET